MTSCEYQQYVLKQPASNGGSRRGRGAGARVPFIFRPNWGPTSRKFGGGQGLVTGPPPYLKVWIRHWHPLCSTTRFEQNRCDLFTSYKNEQLRIIAHYTALACVVFTYREQLILSVSVGALSRVLKLAGQ